MKAEQRFGYVKYDEKSLADCLAAKAEFVRVTEFVESILPPGRPLSLALTHLEDAFMWVGKGIRDAQVIRDTPCSNPSMETTLGGELLGSSRC